MAYNDANLVLTGNQQDPGPFYWVYTTSDTVGTVEGGGYFSGAFGRLRLGDIIRAACSNGTEMLRVTDARTSGSLSINTIEAL